MGLLFGKNILKIDNKEISDRTFGFTAGIIKDIKNKKLSKSELQKSIQTRFFDLFNQVLGEEDNLAEGILTYAKLEDNVIKNFVENNDEFLKSHNIDIYKFTLEPNEDNLKDTDSSKSYINKDFAKEIADWPNEKYARLVNDLKKHARAISDTNVDPDLTDYRNQIKALKDAKKQRSFGRRIKEFFNGTWLKEKKMLDEIDKSLKENFQTEKKNERIQREEIERNNLLEQEKNKGKNLENSKKKIVVNELDESKVDYEELTDEQFDEIERQIEQEREKGI